MLPPSRPASLSRPSLDSLLVGLPVSSSPVPVITAAGPLRARYDALEAELRRATRDAFCVHEGAIALRVSRDEQRTWLINRLETLRADIGLHSQLEDRLIAEWTNNCAQSEERESLIREFAIENDALAVQLRQRLADLDSIGGWRERHSSSSSVAASGMSREHSGQSSSSRGSLHSLSTRYSGSDIYQWDNYGAPPAPGLDEFARLDVSEDPAEGDDDTRRARGDPSRRGGGGGGGGRGDGDGSGAAKK